MGHMLSVWTVTGNGKTEKRQILEELKKEPVTVFLILINMLVFVITELTGGTEDTMHMLRCGAAYTHAIIL